jgi:hypothetical protein
LVEKSLRALEAHGELVRKNRSAYGTLLLAMQFLAFLYRRALTEGDSSQAGWVFLAKLERQWDRERHADDPRKWSTRFAFDRNEHLLLSFGDSLAKG